MGESNSIDMDLGMVTDTAMDIEIQIASYVDIVTTHIIYLRTPQEKQRHAARSRSVSGRTIWLPI